MKALKNLEVIFTVAVAIACAASYASYASFVQAPAAVEHAARASSTMHVVTVTAKRLTAEEKQRSLRQERAAVQGSATASL